LVVVGAGSAGVAVADQVHDAIVADGATFNPASLRRSTLSSPY
jgi:malic enzyme